MCNTGDGTAGPFGHRPWKTNNMGRRGKHVNRKDELLRRVINFNMGRNRYFHDQIANYISLYGLPYIQLASIFYGLN